MKALLHLPNGELADSFSFVVSRCLLDPIRMDENVRRQKLILTYDQFPNQVVLAALQIRFQKIAHNGNTPIRLCFMQTLMVKGNGLIKFSFFRMQKRPQMLLSKIGIFTLFILFQIIVSQDKIPQAHIRVDKRNES